MYNQLPFTSFPPPGTSHIHVVPVDDVHLLTNCDAVPRTLPGAHRQYAAADRLVGAARPFTSVVGHSAHHDDGEHVTDTTVAEVKSALYRSTNDPMIGGAPHSGLFPYSTSVLEPPGTTLPSKYQYLPTVPQVGVSSTGAPDRDTVCPLSILQP